MEPNEPCFKIRIRENHLHVRMARAFGRKRMMERVNADNIILRDGYDNKWNLKLDNTGNDDDDSDEFVRDNMIEAGDVLWCKHERDNVIKFFIRDSSNNPKPGVGRFLMDVEEDFQDMDAEQTSDDNEDDNDSRDEEEEYEAKVGWQCETSKHFQRGTKVGCSRGKTSKHSQKRHQMNKRDIFTLGRAQRPENPYFVTKINWKRVDELFVPKKFYTECEIEFPKVTFLTDSYGRGWRTELKTSKDGRVTYYGGWEDLCIKNNVGETDHCVCEFIPLEFGYHIRVNIIRADLD